MRYGYIRTSPFHESQEHQQMCLSRYSIDKYVIDDEQTNTREFQKLRSQMTDGDTLIIPSLTVIPKGPSQLITLFKELTDKGITITIAETGTIDQSSIGELIINMIESFMAFEKHRVIETTQAGKKKAKENPDFKEGRPKKYSDDELQRALELLKQYSYKSVEEITGISVSTLTREKKKSKMRKRRG
jgi:DNA invertase Pin-like site-specific DNA recombinase